MPGLFRVFFFGGFLAVLGLTATEITNAQPFYHGYRANQVRGRYFGPHRPYTGHVSGHIGFLSYPSAVYARPQIPRHRYEGYRVPRRGYTMGEARSYSYAYRESYQEGAAYWRESCGYVGQGRYEGYHSTYPRAFVVESRRTWLRPPATYLTTKTQTPWRARMESAVEETAHERRDRPEAVPAVLVPREIRGIPKSPAEDDSRGPTELRGSDRKSRESKNRERHPARSVPTVQAPSSKGSPDRPAANSARRGFLYYRKTGRIVKYRAKPELAQVVPEPQGKLRARTSD